MATLDIAEFDAVLGILQAPDNAARARAEGQLDLWAPNPTFLQILMMCARRSPAAGNRQLAATLLSWRLPKLWPLLPEAAQHQTQVTLLECFGTCDEPLVLRALGEACNALCQKIAVVHDVLWEDLLRLVAGLIGNDSPARRRAALELLGSLVDSMGLRLRAFYAELSGTMVSSLQDPDADVRVAALGAIGVVAASWCASDEDKLRWQSAATATLEAGASALNSLADSQSACKVLVAALRALSKLAAFLPSEASVSATAELACTALTCQRSSETCQSQALQVVRALVRKAPTMLRDQVVSALVTVVCRMAKDCSPSVDDLDEVSPTALAARDCLRSMARMLPARVVPSVFEFAQAASQSADAMDRAAAVHVVVFTFSGTREAPEGWAIPLTRALSDRAIWVRQAACEGATTLAGALRPAPSTTDGLLLLLLALADLLPREKEPELIQKAALAVAAIFHELSSDEAAKALKAVVSATLTALRSAAEVANVGAGDDAKAAAGASKALLAAVAAAAETGRDFFTPFAASSAAVLLPLLRNCPSSEVAAIGRAGSLTPAIFAACLDAAGSTVASAWAEASFLATREEMAALALKVLLDRSAASEVRASAHNFFACVAKASFEEFAPSLPSVVPPAVEALMHIDEGETTVTTTSRRRAVRTGGEEERVAAVEALGAYSAASGAAFAPHLPRALPVVCQQAGLASVPVRVAVGGSLGQLGRSLGDLCQGLPEGSADKHAASEMACRLIQALQGLVQAGDESASALRSALQAKEDLLECKGFLLLAGPDGAAALAAVGGGQRSEFIESSDDDDAANDDEED